MKIVTVDFETHGIENYPRYPPEPVGVSIKEGDKKSKYYAFGHREGNNCLPGRAQAELYNYWKDAQGGACQLLFHNAKFDMAVAEKHFKFSPLPYTAFHDTMLLAFLHDPNAYTFGLKPLSNSLLGMPPEEQDAVNEWINANVRVNGRKPKKSELGAHISKAPGDLVGKYANGDVDRTKGLYDYMFESVVEKRGMSGAYDRERRILPYLMHNEEQGIRVDLLRLERDTRKYEKALVKADAWIKSRLGDINLDSPKELPKALINSNVVDRRKLLKTPKGAVSTNQKSINRAVKDPRWSVLLAYRAKLSTCLSMFMRNWVNMAGECDGVIHTSWNQVRQARDSRDSMGASTGRLSSTPNFQNIPRDMHTDLKSIYELTGLTLPELPAVRTYVAPWDKDHVLIGRDLSQIEPRLLAHFGRGVLMERYNEDPTTDFHDFAKSLLDAATGQDLKREIVKAFGLGAMYGRGYKAIGAAYGLDPDKAKDIRDELLKAIPEVVDINYAMRCKEMRNEPFTTWGGRQYYVEPPKVIDGRLRTFGYKMINRLIQGSAADLFKESVIELYEHMPKGFEVLPYLFLHDEIIASVPKEYSGVGMSWIDKALTCYWYGGKVLDVPLLSDGKVYGRRWSK